MPFNGLFDYIKTLEENNDLIRVTEFVSPNLEITEITDRISKQKDGGKALLFENNGTAFPLLINSMGSINRICMVLNTTSLEGKREEIEKIFRNILTPKVNLIEKLGLLSVLNNFRKVLPQIVKRKAPCQEVIITKPTLEILPVLKCWQHDGGAFITLPCVNTKDPLTGIRNTGMYRMQILDPQTTAMHWHKHKVGARHFEMYKQLGKRMPLAVSLGGDPIYALAAAAPLPDNIDEYALAGFLRNESVKLVRCITQPDIEVPADADIIIEGYIDPNEEFALEGPFGDHTGFYSLPDFYPKFHVTAITHRKQAVYPATIVGIPPMEDAYIAKAIEIVFFAPLKFAMLPEIEDIDIPTAGVAHNLTIIKIKKTFAGQAQKAANALWGAGQMMFNKIMIVVSNTVDIHNYTQLAENICTHCNPATDILFSKGPLDILDHASCKQGLGSKMCIDATVKFEDEKTKSRFSELNVFKMKPLEDIKKNFPEISEINTELLEKNISLIIISLHKNLTKNVRETAEILIKEKYFSTIKFMIITDSEVDIFDFQICAWFCANNIDPHRDCTIFAKDNHATLIIDACRKTKNHDDFERDWPNVIVADNQTIATIDRKWNKLMPDEFLPSPSLKFKQLVKNSGAVASENI